MTEAEWLDCGDPNPMLGFLADRISLRKLRQFGVACCRRISNLLDEHGKAALVALEAYSEGLIGNQPLDDACRRLGSELTGQRLAHRGGKIICASTAVVRLFIPQATEANDFITSVIADGVEFAASAAGRGIADEPDKHEKAVQATIAREVFGNPFRSLTDVQGWRRSTVLKSAKTIYDDRAFDRMPELADALEAAGCTNKDVLEHCRGGGPHVRGCWVVDLLLGKE
jgi:hypothetical protein